MDPEYERLERLLNLNEDLAASTGHRFEVRPPRMDLRLFMLEEFYDHISRKYNVVNPYSNSPEALRRAAYVDQGIPYIFIRFCETLKGFHKGYLDLTGRHPHRYHSIYKRWREFMSDFEAFRRAIQPLDATDDVEHSTHVWVTVRPGDEPRLFTITDRTALSKLEKRWHLHIVDLGPFIALTEDVLECMLKHLKPTFQLLRLVDLPMELLQEVARHVTSKDHRRLGSTCQLLRAICWPYMHEERRIGLRGVSSSFPFYHMDDAKPSEEEQRNATRVKAIAQCDNFFKDVDLICSRPDIAERIRRLTLSCWEWDDIRRVVLKNDLDSLVLNRMRDVTLRTTNLTVLNLYYISITQEFAEAIFALPHLSCLSLDCCKTELALQEPQTTPRQLEHLLVRYHDMLASNQYWSLLRYLPNVRCLQVYVNKRTNSIPPALFIGHTNPFATLERLQVLPLNRNRDEDDFPRLLSLLRDAPTLHLTHVKLRIPVGISELETRVLVDALAPAPLRVLVLEGLYAAPPALFEHIAGALPALEGLTLLFHKSPLKQRLRQTRWPAAAWEYAAALAAFTRLEYFGWNFRVGAMPSPAAMLHFETGFCCAGECVHAEAVDATVDDVDGLLPLFAARCPTLRSLAFHGIAFAEPLCSISRDAHGRPVFDVHRDVLYDSTFTRELAERYNPDYYGTWSLSSGTSNAWCDW